MPQNTVQTAPVAPVEQAIIPLPVLPQQNVQIAPPVVTERREIIPIPITVQDNAQATGKYITLKSSYMDQRIVL